MTAEEINEAFRARRPPAGSTGSCATRRTRSSRRDIQHSPYSCIFDSELTMANGSMVKVFGWYDNEWGYSCRLVDLTAKVARRCLSARRVAMRLPRSVRDAEVAASACSCAPT